MKSFSGWILILCIMSTCYGSTYNRQNQSISTHTNQQYTYTNNNTLRRRYPYSSESSSYTTSSTADPILALVIFVALSSLMF
ncbi:hypothetical protein BDB01DRAFT_807980 [Pilobolus umbonatus]|nr:hypothetical protein BDB01DRAFT_807980 [Pilobolus umbonatus]